MLDEKTMVSDALAGVNGELVRYGEMISQTENKELKQKLKQIRNDCEMSQGKTLSDCPRKKLLCSCRQSYRSGNLTCKKHSCKNFHTLVSNARDTENLPPATSLAYFGI